MNPLILPMKDIVSGVNDAGSQATTAIQSVGAVVVIAILVQQAWKAGGALAALFTGGLAAGFGWWLIKMNGLATMGTMWDTTWTKFFG